MLVWAWIQQPINTNLVDHKIIFSFRIEYHAWLWKFVLLDALYGCAKNEKEIASKEALITGKVWILYIGGNEHGHLLYSRFGINSKR
jgi:hypothetical protein